MKVVIINKSDLNGGAAVVSYRLMQALRQQGVDAKMLVLEKLSDDENVVVSSAGRRDRYNFLAERLHIYLCSKLSRENLFKVDTALWGQDMSRHPLVKDADAVLLNWVNQGALTLKSIGKICALGKPVVWTMHDMWNITGICHHALNCRGYREQCGHCQFLKSNSFCDLSSKTQWRKRDLYRAHDIKFVAVSHWLADRCTRSALMLGDTVKVIPNGFPIDDFDCERRNDAFHGIPAGKTVIAMGAARLDDSIKGFGHLIKATQIIAETKPELAAKLHLLLYGGIRDASLLEQIAIPVTYIGKIKGAKAINDVYSHADIVLSTSLYETFGATLVEGMACGCMAVTFGNGGQPDIVDHEKTGYIAEYENPQSIVDGIEWVAGHRMERKQLHEEMNVRFSAEKIAKDYISLLSELKQKQKQKK